MEPFISENGGIWLKAQFVVNDSLQTTPRRVMVYQRDEENVLSFSGPNWSIIMCKEPCIQHVSTIIQRSSLENCNYRTVLMAEGRMATDEFLQDSCMSSAGLMAATSSFSRNKYLLFACEQFLDNFGFYDKEIVWFSVAKPLPLSHVVLKCTSPTNTEQTITELVSQLYEQCPTNTVIAKTGFNLLHYLTEADDKENIKETHSSDNDDELSWIDDASSDDSLAPPTSLFVMETTPVMQGRITQDTTLVIMPYKSPAPSLEEPVISAGSSAVSVDDNAFNSASTEQSPVFYSASRLRTVSASDIFEESGQVHIDMTPFVHEEDHSISLPTTIRSRVRNIMTTPPPLPDISFTIEVCSGEEFTLLYHDVVLPKAIARKHNIYDLQNILIAPVITEYTTQPTNIRDTTTGTTTGTTTSKITGTITGTTTGTTTGTITSAVITLNNELRYDKESMVLTECGQISRKRLAIARVYETKEQLQSLVPRTKLSQAYTSEDLNKAYLHPELVFNLYPETLSIVPRRFYISIENMIATPSPSPMEFNRENPPPLATNIPGKHLGKKTDIRKIIVGSLALPTSPFTDDFINQSIKKHLIDSPKKVIVSKGDVFSINTELGKLFLRVLFTIPEVEYGGVTGDEVVYNRSFASYLPHIFYPAHPISYWDTPLAPGLEGYCNTLFQYFLSSLLPNKGNSFSCASVLVSGPPGIGKSTVIRSVAKRCRLNVIEFNCYDFFSEGLKVAEQKLTNAFSKGIDYIPCVMVLKEIHVFTRLDPSISSGGHEPRIETIFELQISQISKELMKAVYPLIIVGVSSNPKDVSPRIQHCFQHQLSINPPTQEQRIKLLQGLTLDYPISKDIDLVDVARRSAGFVLGDYLELFSKAHNLAATDILKLIQQHSDDEDSWINEYHISIFGTLINQSHLDSALNRLHSLHSGYIGAPKIPNVKWKDVGGLEEAKREILETIQLPLLHPELFVGDLRRSGVLLYGAPGTGKTLLAKAVANECMLNFLSVKGPELINMYVGQTEENIREIFDRARGAAPCVVFFDELDSLAPNRGKSGDSGGVMDRVVSQLLAELDGLDQKKDVFVIGATNRPDLIDPALLRPGRFDRLVYLDVCDQVESKLTILKAITRKFTLYEDVNLLAVAEACHTHLTGADLYALCADAMLASLRRQIDHLEANNHSDAEWEGSLVVCQNDFMRSLENLKPSVSKEELAMYREKQFLQNIS